MNDSQIEYLLRKAPIPPPPATLLDDLHAAVCLNLPETRATPGTLWFLFKRWWPAVACLAIGVTVIAGQIDTAAKLRRENELLKTATAQFDDLRRQNAEYQQLAGVPVEVESLKANRLELQALTAEIARLRQALAELEQINEQNQRLLRELNLPSDQLLIQEGTAGMESISCFNNIANIAQGSRVWATDHDNILPTDFLVMTNELVTPKILVCPSDQSRLPLNWDSFTWANCTEANVSYELLSPGAVLVGPSGPGTEPQVVFARCRVHGHVVLVNGSIKRSNPSWSFVHKEGKWLLERNEK
jgi:hypothetical protein